MTHLPGLPRVMTETPILADALALELVLILGATLNDD